ncbi:MAG: (2E,6E)-farnesyl diphosphate synthase [Gammaproteobacteria bacterium]|nr:(2E,6E)-farnesyl diphosphate synthase [Gammaproteobacteria bacterium]MCP4984292.1 (2E,6E)-farnesyl diphosphate synthase [Gammaproteobacteria bacterium]
MKIDAQPFESLVDDFQQRVDAALERWLPQARVNPIRLHRAMRYAVLAPGKRVRPILVYATASALDIDLERVDGAAAAVEIIHAYSLIHDDLPAMDDDDLRRGRPTCHREFDEATAILAGDALQALAFYIISHDPQMVQDDTARLQMIEKLSLFSGSRGMAGGQAIDLAAVGKTLNIAELETMHIHKTGALIRTCVQLAAHSTSKLSTTQFKALDSYAKCIGLSFQVQDDILDVTGDTATLGKTQGSDSARNKPTFPSIIGLDASREKAQELHRKALQALSIFGEEADILRYISAWFVERTH